MTSALQFFTKGRRTIKSVSFGMFVVGLVFVSYQIFIIRLIEIDNKKSTYDGVVTSNDISEQTVASSSRLREEFFNCVKTKKIIPISKVNDDYCDCPLDMFNGDEPQTNACLDSAFFCRDNFKEVVIPSSRVNDGICDCCDGSDEWQKIQAPMKIDRETQKKLGLYLTPCPLTCDNGGR